MDLDEIRQALSEWKRSSDRRDGLVRLAYDSGIPIKEIHELSGLSRSTVYDILGRTADST